MWLYGVAEPRVVVRRGGTACGCTAWRNRVWLYGVAEPRVVVRRGGTACGCRWASGPFSAGSWELELVLAFSIIFLKAKTRLVN